MIKVKKHLLKVTLPLLFVIPFFISSCHKVGKTTTFDFEFNGLATIPDTVVTGVPYDAFTPDLATGSQQKFSEKNTDNDHIESIKLTELDLSVDTPSGGTFSFLDSVWVYLSAPGLTEIELGSKSNVLFTSTSLDLYQSAFDAKSYVEKSDILFRIKAECDEALSSNVIVKLHAKFHCIATEKKK